MHLAQDRHGVRDDVRVVGAQDPRRRLRDPLGSSETAFEEERLNTFFFFAHFERKPFVL